MEKKYLFFLYIEGLEVVKESNEEGQEVFFKDSNGKKYFAEQFPPAKMEWDEFYEEIVQDPADSCFFKYQEVLEEVKFLQGTLLSGAKEVVPVGDELWIEYPESAPVHVLRIKVLGANGEDYDR